ncbi:MAG: BlaI/MecI/CopY family transcriptional regulator [Bacteroidales bacterium]|nr:BlaI/MecI/CopY family transcriptional regulator [Bacteroidales bacterium]
MTKRLTKAEEEIMLILWKLGESTIREVMTELSEPNTPYTTVSTVVRVLEKKEFVSHKAVGTTYLYYPLIQKKDYLRGYLTGIVSNYFDGSFTRMAAFFARENDLDMGELHELITEIESELKESDNHE